MNRCPPERIRTAWEAIVGNYDSALAQRTSTRDHLISLNADGFEQVRWREAIRDRVEQYPEFFENYDYSWCDNRECFDFPIEAAYQVRAIDAAIGLWCSPLVEKPAALHLGHIVARTTYLSRFEHATPRAKSSAGFDFLITPLGWIEFVHRFYGAFGRAWDFESPARIDWNECCADAWNAISANLIASLETEVDHDLPGLVEAVATEVPFFRGALVVLTASDETDLSRDLARAAQDFAICHEVAHIAAQDETSPDEVRADRWGLAAYIGSWPLQLPLHLNVARADDLRAALGPLAFSWAVQCLLAARVHVARASGQPPEVVERRLRVLRAGIERSQALIAHVDSGVSAFVARGARGSSPEEMEPWNRLVRALSSYVVAFVGAAQALPPDACIAALAAARRAGDETRQAPAVHMQT